MVDNRSFRGTSVLLSLKIPTEYEQYRYCVYQHESSVYAQSNVNQWAPDRVWHSERTPSSVRRSLDQPMRLIALATWTHYWEAVEISHYLYISLALLRSGKVCMNNEGSTVCTITWSCNKPSTNGSSHTETISVLNFNLCLVSLQNSIHNCFSHIIIKNYFFFHINPHSFYNLSVVKIKLQTAVLYCNTKFALQFQQ